VVIPIRVAASKLKALGMGNTPEAINKLVPTKAEESFEAPQP
jgi:hypothetical protein